jgi:hypothetical protein
MKIESQQQEKLEQEKEKIDWLSAFLATTTILLIVVSIVYVVISLGGWIIGLMSK